MAESVRVICRCRPFNQREIKLSSKVCVDMDPSIGQCVVQNGEENPAKSFTFDGVYWMDSTAEQIYNDIVYPLVENVIEGYNGTVFAYGQTGSGKTFSMQGLEGNTPQRGIIPRTFEHIFESIATTEHTKFLVHVSYLEIYNEDVRDLLGTDKQKLDIKEHSERGVYVAGLSMHVCHNVKDCEQLMQEGFHNRHVGATLMNKDSSRSHSIFTVYVEALSESGSIRMGKLNLVDLAGSERQAKTGATGERFKEATKINLSLSALGNVISALVDGKSKHIPYRDSKLTRLLQDSLGGNTKTVMIACISPSDNNFDETLSTLRYANRAKNIKNKPRINEDPKDALLREYQEEIQRLKMLMQQPAAVVHQAPSTAEIEAEKQKLRAEFEQAMNELKASYEHEQKSKEKLQSDLLNLKDQYQKANEEIEAARKQENAQLVGGEQVGNEALKQKRKKKIKEAEKRMRQLAEALNVHKDDPLLHVYTSTQDKLDATVLQYTKEIQKTKALESEIQDLQGEFELDRLDYLETIRKQDQQLKLLQQLLERIQPTIRKDCNYANLDKIKRDAVWSEDQSRWILPEMTIGSSGLKPMNGLPNAGKGVTGAHFVDHNDSENEDADSRLKRKLDQSMDNDFVSNYFKPVAKGNILDKYNADRHKTQVQEKISNFVRRNQKVDGLLNGVVYADEIYDNQNSNGLLNVGIGGRNTSLGNRSNSAMRKPAKLEALNVVQRNKSFT
ncbi:kinesin motor domain-containing protein [Ditylenchus destructor]|uniref:Kinesin-like protein n=1 Tax=Ditylenchus destructor TaxID=166010 RepID=A0AAD4MMF4_9BILA|nr:kinesin motor domain-containing protein [Ditylenchus destructor]